MTTLASRNALTSTNSNISRTQPEIDVCIVGGGLSGLSAAYKILERSPMSRVVVLESDSDIGGNLESSKLGELGGRWITEDQYHVYNLCRVLNVRLRKRFIMQKELKRCWEIDKATYSNLSRFEVKRFIAEVEYNATQYYPGSYYITKNSKSMEDYIRSKLFFENSRTFIRCFVRLISGVEAEDVSIVEFFTTLYGSGNLSQLISLFTGASNSILEFSSKELLSALESHINKYAIFLRTKITDIQQYSNYVIVQDNKKNTFRATVLIMAVPWQQVQRIPVYPPIPPELRIRMFESKFMITSFLADYRESYWRKYGSSGSVVLHNPHMICYELRPTVYGGIVLHEEDFETILQPIVLKRLSQCFGAEMGLPTKWIQRTWEQPTLLNLPPTTPWNHIIWASSTSATCYRGMLGGAVQSGYRAAVHALLVVRPQIISWHDIDEVQRAGAVHQRTNFLYTALASLNFYSSTFYLIMAGVAIVAYKTARGGLRMWGYTFRQFA